jgi:alanine racemase
MISIPSNIASFAPTTAHIRLDRLRKNASLLQKHVQGMGMIGVVKANGYGHGAIRVAEALKESGVRYFAVATVPEGIALREAGIREPIFVMGAPLPSFLPAYQTYQLDLNISSLDVMNMLKQQNKSGDHWRVHLKIDTGMRRLGLEISEVEQAMALLDQMPNVERIGLWSHFAVSDESTNSFNQKQLSIFQDVMTNIGATFSFAHIANSGGIIHHFLPNSSPERQMVRCGIELYGCSPVSHHLPLEPVMRFQTKVVHLKNIEANTPVSYGQIWTSTPKTRIATISAGYADGYPRSLSNCGWVEIRGKRFPVVGRVCMDMCMVDIGDAEVQIGDDVLLWGESTLNANEVATWANTIPYTLVTGVGARVPRIYEG